jgi:hypothetical protein
MTRRIFPLFMLLSPLMDYHSGENTSWELAPNTHGIGWLTATLSARELVISRSATNDTTVADYSSHIRQIAGFYC